MAPSRPQPSSLLIGNICVHCRPLSAGPSLPKHWLSVLELVEAYAEREDIPPDDLAMETLLLLTEFPYLGEIMLSESPEMATRYGPVEHRPALLLGNHLLERGYWANPHTSPLYEDMECIYRSSQRLQTWVADLRRGRPIPYASSWTTADGGCRTATTMSPPKRVVAAASGLRLWLLYCQLLRGSYQPQHFGVLLPGTSHAEIVRAFANLPAKPSDDAPPSTPIYILLVPLDVCVSSFDLQIASLLTVLDCGRHPTRVVPLIDAMAPPTKPGILSVTYYDDAAPGWPNHPISDVIRALQLARPGPITALPTWGACASRSSNMCGGGD